MSSITPESLPSRHVLADRLTLPSVHPLALNAVLVAAGTALVALSAQVTVPLWPVPVTGQTLAVLLVGSALGARRGALSLVVYAAVGLAGAPVFADGKGGPGMLTAPSFGYVIGFVFAAWLIGALAERRWDRRVSTGLAAQLLASVVPFVVGLPWLAFSLARLGLPHDLQATLEGGLYPFVPGGLVKAGLAALLLPLIWKLTSSTRR
ncbi:biotin transporter BioY [Kineosporia succinea]|uniref:Biotin transporter n=1 Tax=Kineosporia succinea TaxID=84632 RepID=A0ABT9PAC6_9ACTN|nr:biotin transporter BioY [Kineosporia succinea]MDP9829631.1 biotin transport system substrate-specific component [Kineosporia succinea]